MDIMSHWKTTEPGYTKLVLRYCIKVSLLYMLSKKEAKTFSNGHSGKVMIVMRSERIDR